MGCFSDNCGEFNLPDNWFKQQQLSVHHLQVGFIVEEVDQAWSGWFLRDTQSSFVQDGWEHHNTEVYIPLKFIVVSWMVRKETFADEPNDCIQMGMF